MNDNDAFQQGCDAYRDGVDPANKWSLLDQVLGEVEGSGPEVAVAEAEDKAACPAGFEAWIGKSCCQN